MENKVLLNLGDRYTQLQESIHNC